MSEFKPGHDPLIWRLLEGLAISILIVIAFLVAIGEIIMDATRHWWGGNR
jgi:hypothetical protein